MKRIGNLLSEPAKVFLVSRLLILVILISSSQLNFHPVVAREGKNFNPEISLNAEKISVSLDKIWRSADGSWYLIIAERGYDSGPATADSPHNWVFFPLFPLLVRALQSLTGESLISGLLISNLSFFVSLVLLSLLSQKLGHCPEQTRNALWLLGLYPTSFFFSSPLTESLFLCLILASFLCVHQHRLISAGLFMMLATATRPTGLLVLPAFAASLWKDRLRPRALAALLICPLGALLFMYFLYHHTGNPLSWMENQQAWGRHIGSFHTLVSGLPSQISEQFMAPWNFTALNLAAAVLALVICIQFFVTREFSWGLLIGLPIAVVLCTGTTMSLSRYTMVLFPIYFVLGKWALYPLANKILYVLFSALLALMTALYACHVTSAMA